MNEREHTDVGIEVNGGTEASGKSSILKPGVLSYPPTIPSLQRSTLLLLRVIHSDLKDRRSLAAQKGHSGWCAFHAPFQAVDAAAPVLSPKEVVAMVTQAKGMIQFRTLVYNLGTEEMFLRRGGQIGMPKGRLGALVVLTPTGDPERTLSIRLSYGCSV